MRLPVALAAMLVVWGNVCLVAAQKKPPEAKHAKPANNKGPGGQQRIPPRNEAKELENFLNMPAGDREKALSKLPEKRRARIEQQIQHFESLPPAQRERQLRRLEAFQALPPGRRPVVRQEIQDLQALPPKIRRDRLNGEEFRQSFSPEEQQLIRERFERPKNP